MKFCILKWFCISFDDIDFFGSLKNVGNFGFGGLNVEFVVVFCGEICIGYVCWFGYCCLLICIEIGWVKCSYWVGWIVLFLILKSCYVEMNEYVKVKIDECLLKLVKGLVGMVGYYGCLGLKFKMG